MDATTAEVRRSEPELWTYTSAPPEGDWEYELDDHGLIYSRRWLWPFARRLRDRSPEQTVLAGGRLAPNSAYQAWGGSYVLAFPSEDGLSAGISLYVHVEPKGERCWLVSHFHARLDLTTWEATFDLADPDHEEAARVLLDKVVSFLRASCEARDSGKRKPVFAHDRWVARGGDRA